MPYQSADPAAAGAITARGWTLVLLSVACAFAVLSLSPPRVFGGVLLVIPAALFTAIPLVTLHAMSSSGARNLFRGYSLGAFGQSIMFGIATLTASLSVALILLPFAPLEANRAGDVLTNADALAVVIFLVRTFIQLVGEEVVTILPLLAVVRFSMATTGIGRRGGLAAGVVVSTLLFSAMHLPTYNWNVVQCFVVIGTARLVLTASYLRTGNLWVSSGAHIMNDWSIFAVGYAGSHLPIGA
ncbi:CPBP family intramembrane metalloprotease [Tianweitania sp. BSSL-BM11]|uniref:CPBP family intramembrane metalloprotease n=1 Tax=Tianweitania aestuarii TaxID=2814886 RepID=A0ABS5RTB5_9HYPH|nr:CPBP family intramembrane glutamic endopeptidase [Tianweitania aestuarii]MBS9719521.1 CPBP family intramembrane metalloprotease [Tianweitania aestuarii]